MELWDYLVDGTRGSYTYTLTGQNEVTGLAYQDGYVYSVDPTTSTRHVRRWPLVLPVQ